ncbi:hypothetical protein Hte_006469 [Hypoxylon texense]
MSSQAKPITYPHNVLGIDKAEVRAAGNMGTGVFATKDIAKGEVIFIDTPILILNDMNDTEEFITKYLSLPEEIAQYLDNCYLSEAMRARYANDKTIQFQWWWKRNNNRIDMAEGNDYWHPLIDKVVRAYCIYATNNAGNSLKMDSTAFYPTFSRINHSCVPSSDWQIDDGPDYFVTMRALRDIPAGEQIFLSYDYRITDPNRMLSRAARQKILDTWGFVCSCPRCLQE